MLGLSSTEIVVFFSPWFILRCHSSIGHEIGGRPFSGMSKRDPRLFVYCLKGADTSCEISHACTDCQAVLSVTNVRGKQPVE